LVEVDSGDCNGYSCQQAVAPETAEYTIDELAAVSRVPSRTIRFYQSAGAIPRPDIRGRIAYYGSAHVERLKLVADLQDRGLRIKAICALLGKIDRGELDLSEWLGLEAQLGAPWANDKPRVLDERELSDAIGERRPGLVAELVRFGLIDHQGDAFLVPSPGLLQVAMRLHAAGVDLETAAGGLSILRKHARRAARDLAKLFFKRAAAGFGRGARVTDLEAAFGALRPMSQEGLRLAFGQEMERLLRELLESGKSAAITRSSAR
jgi:DNA-binding transcriptional MerR regulator